MSPVSNNSGSYDQPPQQPLVHDPVADDVTVLGATLHPLLREARVEYVDVAVVDECVSSPYET